MNGKEQLANEIKVIEDANSKNGLTEYGKGQLKALKYAMELFDLYVVGVTLPEHECKYYVNADWTYLSCECGKRITPEKGN